MGHLHTTMTTWGSLEMTGVRTRKSGTPSVVHGQALNVRCRMILVLVPLYHEGRRGTQPNAPLNSTLDMGRIACAG